MEVRPGRLGRTREELADLEATATGQIPPGVATFVKFDMAVLQPLTPPPWRYIIYDSTPNLIGATCTHSTTPDLLARGYYLRRGHIYPWAFRTTVCTIRKKAEAQAYHRTFQATSVLFTVPTRPAIRPLALPPVPRHIYSTVVALMWPPHLLEHAVVPCVGGEGKDDAALGHAAQLSHHVCHLLDGNQFHQEKEVCGGGGGGERSLPEPNDTTQEKGHTLGL